jgi:hypothetical protein
VEERPFEGRVVAFMNCGFSRCGTKRLEFEKMVLNASGLNICDPERSTTRSEATDRAQAKDLYLLANLCYRVEALSRCGSLRELRITRKNESLTTDH